MAVGITSQLQLRSTYIYIYTCIKLLVYVKDLDSIIILVKRASVKENFLTNQSFLAFMIVRVV